MEPISTPLPPAPPIQHLLAVIPTAA